MGLVRKSLPEMDALQNEALQTIVNGWSAQ